MGGRVLAFGDERRQRVARLCKVARGQGRFGERVTGGRGRPGETREPFDARDALAVALRRQGLQIDLDQIGMRIGGKNRLDAASSPAFDRHG